MKQKAATNKKLKKDKALRPPPPKKSAQEILPGFNYYFDKHGLLILIFLLIVISLFVFKDFIFLEKIYLYKDIGSDSINATYPHEVQVAYYMQQVSLIPKWSFYQGMGQNIFPFCIPDPYYLILLLFGPKNLIYGIGYMEIAKIISAGILFYLFLKKIRLSGYAAVLGGLLYSFSGFMILGSCWTIFSTEAVYIALLLYAFEKLYKDNKIILFPIAICLIAINQPFDLVLAALFLTAYILFRYFDDHRFNFKELIFLFLKVAGLGLLGVLISSFFLFPDIIQMLESPRVGGDSSNFSRLLSTPPFSFGGKSHNVSALMRFFSNDMMGTGSDYKGWYNYLESPLFYAGLINLLLIPQLFRFLDKKRKIIFFSFLIVFLFPVVFPFFRYSFWLFTGDYYRLFSFFIAIIFLLYSVTGLNFIDKNSRPNFLILGISMIVLLVLLLHNYFPDQEIINEELRNITILFLVCYAILIALLRSKRFRPIIKSLILILVSIELISFSNITVDRPVIEGSELKQKTGYNDYSVDAINYLKERDKSFYRVNKDYGSGPTSYESINDAQVQNYYGTPSYTSFNQINYVKFLQEMNIIDPKKETQTRWAWGLMLHPLLHPFGSIKYSLVKLPNSFLLSVPHDSITTIGDIKIIRPRYSLPLGFTYDKFITKKDFRKISADKKQVVLYKAFVLDDSIYTNVSGFSNFQLPDTAAGFSWPEYEADINALKKDSLRISMFSQNLVRGKINVDKKKLLFFSIPFDKGWVARIDGKKIDPMMVNIGFIGLPLDKGDHEIELSFTPRYFRLGAIISLGALIFFVLLIIVKIFVLKKN
jgi:uncharacterized membrane protein YfhO